MADKSNISLLSHLNVGTSQLVIYNNQGLAVRSLNYYRSEIEKAVEPRISLQRYDSAGYLKHSIDARLSKQYLQDPASTIPNQNQVNTLSGTVLQSKNVDAGTRFSLSDVRGLTLWANDSLENERTFDYDTLGRMTRVSEKTPEKKILCSERFVYGDKASKEVNGIGRLLKHYDSAGLHEIKSYGMQAGILQESRQFLANTTNVDWPEDLTERQKLLETETYTTQWAYNGLGETISQTDAKANKHYTVYGVTGELVSTGLQLANGTEQALITKQSYSATGQLLEKHLANGVVIQYSYEEKTQRLRRLHSVRLSDSKSLQDLNYRYDPVGNILEIIDKAQEANFYANEKTEAISQYRYDSLYQLIEASGIESQQAGKENATQNPALPLGNPDASRCVNYTRTYKYDAGGNLYAIQHRGAQNYTRDLQIAADSNRGIEKRDSGPSLVESFDGNGNLLYLSTDQPLQWDNRNQLQQVVQLKRETHSDVEQYRYDAGGQRVEKLTQRLAQEQIHSDRVRYLPGLELREHWQTDTRGQNKKITEQLHVIQNDSVRVLHWETGKPNEIENDDLRYTLTDQLDSTQLELNAKSEIINYENYYPYGGTAIWATKNNIENSYKFIRYSGKERDATGLYYYGYRYYLPWLGRWLNPDPSGISDGLNLFQMAHNNPITFYDDDGRDVKDTSKKLRELYPRVESATGNIVSHYIPGESGQYYRDIKKIPGTFFSTTVNYRALEVGPTGKELYLLTGKEQAKRVVIFAHGAFDPNVIREFYLTPASPKFTFLTPHGSRLLSYLKSIMQKSPAIYAKVSYEGIEPTSENAERDLDFSYSMITGAASEKALGQYYLHRLSTKKFERAQQEGASSVQVFPNLYKHLFQYTAYLKSSLEKEGGPPTDIVTLRKKAGHFISFERVVKFLQSMGYEEIVCHFCRGKGGRNVTGEQKFTFYTEQEVKQLPGSPILKTWDSMKKWPSKETWSQIFW
jgi:insecticidal toxin complex protein TccC